MSQSRQTWIGCDLTSFAIAAIAGGWFTLTAASLPSPTAGSHVFQSKSGASFCSSTTVSLLYVFTGSRFWILVHDTAAIFSSSA